MAHEDDRVLVFADTIRRSREDIESAASRAGTKPVVSTDAREAITILRSERVRVVVVDMASPGVSAVFRTLGDQPQLHAIPIIAVVPDASSDAFAEAHQAGADGVVVGTHLSELTECLRSLLASPPTDRVPEVHGTVLVAHPDAHRRRALGRGLRRVGFGVAFAAAATELDEQACRDGVRAMLVGDELLDDEGALTRVGEVHQLPTIVLSETRDVDRYTRVASQLPHVAVAPKDSSAAALVFRLGELLRPGLADVRSSQRLLFSSLCHYRIAGSSDVRHGTSHNLSLDGLYIRALSPPPRGSKLWLELVPPGDDALVHLRVEVMWARNASPSEGSGPTPPGFGVRLLAEECSPPDLEAYRRAYSSLARTTEAGYDVAA